MNAHIINCNERAFFQDFLPNGYLGVGLVLNGLSPRQLSSACRASYSMYADMKTIRKGDILFVHAGQKIYGAFKAESEFLEEPSTPKIFLSKNIHYYPSPKDATRGWKNQVTEIPDLGYYRRIAISAYFDNVANFCFMDGIQSIEIFDLKQQRKIHFVPERWKYTDASRTIRPLMDYEATEILKILHRENSHNSKRHKVRPADLSSYLNIEFNLNPKIIEDEKIIEGWVLQQIGRNKVVDDCLGGLTSFGNNMPVGYLRFIDVLGYQELYGETRKFKVFEVKKDNCVFPNDVNQLLGYMDWVSTNVVYGDAKRVEGTFIAKNFDQNTIEFVKNFNNLGKKIKLVKFDYVPPLFKSLSLRSIV